MLQLQTKHKIGRFLCLFLCLCFLLSLFSQTIAAPEDPEYPYTEEETEENTPGEELFEPDDALSESEEEAEDEIENEYPEEEDENISLPVEPHLFFTDAEIDDPNMWYATADHVVSLAPTPANTAYTRLRTAIQTAAPGVTHIIVPFHINTGSIGVDASVVRVPNGATVVLIGDHPTAADGQAVISDTHGTGVSRTLRVRGNNTEHTALVLRNIVIQNVASATAQSTPATPPAPLTLAAQTGTARGGGASVEQTDGGGGHLILCRGSVIRNSTTDNNGPIDVQTNGRFTMMPGALMHTNAAGNSGGAVRVGPAATFNMRGGTIRDSIARGENTSTPTMRAVGGAVLVHNGGTFNLFDGIIEHNSAAFSTIAAAPNATNGIVTSCGGAVFLSGPTASFNMYGGIIRNNDATRTRSSAVAAGNRFIFRSGNGGAVYAADGATFTMQGGTITGNLASTSGTVNAANALNVANGGAVYLTGAETSFRMQGGYITNNQAFRTVSSVPTTAAMSMPIFAGNGGAVHVADGALFILDGGTISGNTATASGTAPAHNVNGITTLSSGGGVFVTGGSSRMEMHSGLIASNTAAGTIAATSSISGNGGGVHIANGGTFSMSGGSIQQNESTHPAPLTPSRGNGGGISITDGTMHLSAPATISGNTAENGGGIYVGQSGQLNAANGTLTNNRATTDGGGIFSARFVYANILPTTAYNNLSLGSALIFRDNRAELRSRPPQNPEALTHIQTTSSSLEGFHPLNNYDINFRVTLAPVPFTFIKTDERIYNPLEPTFYPLPDAVFQLYRQASDNTWIPQGTAQISGVNGLVTFSLNPGNVYRLVETNAPPYHQTPSGHWIISVDFLTDEMTIYPVGDVPDFIAFEDMLYLSNRYTRLPFHLHKGNNQIYRPEHWGELENFLLSGATFSLYRYNGIEPPDDTILVTTENVGNAENQWTLAQTAVSTGNIEEPMVFHLLPDRIYHLIETIAPEGYALPEGQWRILMHDDDGLSVSVTAIGNHTIPAFFEIDGDFFVGNRPTFILPLSGGTGYQNALVLLGFSLLLLSVVLFLYRLRRKARQDV